jgi:hypothetical protein
VSTRRTLQRHACKRLPPPPTSPDAHALCAVGAPKSRVIAACRLAIKNNAPTAMLPVMATGKATGV